MTIARDRAESPRSRSVERVLWGVFVLNLTVAAAKFFYGLASGSASMQADGVHSVFDSFGNIVGLVGIVLAGRPADRGHPYGHSKFETYGSVVIGFLLLLAAFEVGSTAVGKLVSQNYTAVVTPASFTVMLATLAVNIAVTSYERVQGRKLRSEILSADAAHTLSDVFVSLGVIAGLMLVKLGFPMADPVMALVVTVAIVFSAFEVFKAAHTTLSDHVRIPQEDIAAAALAVEGVVDAHRIRTRGTEAEVYCDLHIHVDPDMSVRRAHEVGNRVELLVMERFPAVREVLVHIEPAGEEVER